MCVHVRVCLHVRVRALNSWSILLQGIPDVVALSSEEPYRFTALSEVSFISRARFFYIYMGAAHTVMFYVILRVIS